MEQVTQTSQGQKVQQRRPKKQGNSEKFNELLSGANQLSVAERVRLTKSLAGQLGLYVGAPKGSPAAEEKIRRGPTLGASQQAVKRPNPLKGTSFEKLVEDAKQGVREAKARLGGAMLPKDDPALVKLTEALKAYKAEKERLAPVATTSAGQNPAPVARGSKKRNASKSPEGTHRNPKDLISSATGAFSAVARRISGNAKGKDQEHSSMEEDKSL